MAVCRAAIDGDADAVERTRIGLATIWTPGNPASLSVHEAAGEAPLCISLLLWERCEARALALLHRNFVLPLTRPRGIEPGFAWMDRVDRYPAAVTIPLPTESRATAIRLQPVAGDLVTCWAAAYFGEDDDE